MNNPVVSVIMPAYNGEKYISEAIESIINQTYQIWELIIVEDCSQDNTLEIIKRYLNDPRIKLYQNDRNIGIAGSRNKAIQMSTGEYIAIQDDDDISYPERLEEEVMFLDKHPDIDAVAGYWMKVDENGKEIIFIQNAYKNPKYVRAHLMLQDCIGNGSAMFRRDFVIRNNLFYQDNMLGMEDYRFWIDFSKKGKISAVDRIVYKQRCHINQESTKRKLIDETERKLLFLSFQKDALEKEGIILQPESYQILGQMACERTDPALTVSDYKKLYDVFLDIIQQANKLGLDNMEEIAVACRKVLGKKIANSKGFWNL